MAGFQRVIFDRVNDTMLIGVLDQEDNKFDYGPSFNKVKYCMASLSKERAELLYKELEKYLKEE